MAFLEQPEFCSIEEFRRYREDRITEDQLVRDELYVYMTRFDDSEQRAAKLPVRVEGINRKAGVAIVRFAFLDETLEALGSVVEPMQMGIITCSKTALYGDPASGEEFRAKEAYLRDYFEDQFGGLLERESVLSLH